MVVCAEFSRSLERRLREAEKKLVAAMKRSEQILEIDEDGTVHNPAAEAAERGQQEAELLAERRPDQIQSERAEGAEHRAQRKEWVMIEEKELRLLRDQVYTLRNRLKKLYDLFSAAPNEQEEKT